MATLEVDAIYLANDTHIGSVAANSFNPDPLDNAATALEAANKRFGKCVISVLLDCYFTNHDDCC